jgi:hypothetical protein
MGPGLPSTSSTRRAGMSFAWARQSRWLRALRPPCTALASSSAPASRIGLASCRYGLPLTVTVPAVA